MRTGLDEEKRNKPEAKSLGKREMTLQNTMEHNEYAKQTLEGFCDSDPHPRNSEPLGEIGVQKSTCRTARSKWWRHVETYWRPINPIIFCETLGVQVEWI